jgi:predicted nucleotidyltransferase
VSLLERYEEVLKALVPALESHYGARLVSCAVFGSVGRGTPRAGSDVDMLLVVKDLPRGRMRRVDEFAAIEDRLARALARCANGGPPAELSPVLKTPEEVTAGSPLLLDMVEDARILHDEGGFLAARLERLRVRLRELGSRRVWRGNAWHWVLKPDLQPGEVFEL